MKRKFLGLLSGSLLFNYFFWGESLGLNLVLFSLFLCVFAIPWQAILSDRPTQALALGSLLTGISVLLVHSQMTVVIHILSVLLLITFSNQQPRQALRSIWFGIPTFIHTLFLIPSSVSLALGKTEARNLPVKTFVRYARLSILPVIFLGIFYFLFAQANPIFSDLSTQLLDQVFYFFEHLFEIFSFERILFFIGGTALVFWALYSQYSDRFAQWESRLKDQIERIRPVRIKRHLDSKTRPTHPSSQSVTPGNFIALKNENRTARILLVLVNLLLIVVNTIEVVWGWFGLEYKGDFDLPTYVHEGTYFLIASILLSMSIILFYFRQNQNFYPYQNQLKPLTYFWIVQNAILVISVAIRNLQYTHYYGLAYKKIGVFVFLLLVLFGLFTLFLKVSRRRSSYFLLRWNSWSVYAAFVAISLFNWDGIILKHNLKLEYTEHLDIEFLVSLSDKALPILDQHPELLDIKNWQHSRNNFHYQLEERIKQFDERYEEETWLSWNLPDHQAYDYFQSKKQH